MDHDDPNTTHDDQTDDHALLDEKREHLAHAVEAAKKHESADGTVDETAIPADDVVDPDEHTSIQNFER